MKLESLVIADQHAAVNTFSGLVHTARHTMEVDYIKSNYFNLFFYKGEKLLKYNL